MKNSNISNSDQQEEKFSIRLKFIKGNEVKYISHLDLMRTFQRAIRRADIPVSYSSGFNPHQEISFGAPLALGVTSNAEYLDLKLKSVVEIEVLVERLNNALPEGIRVLNGILLGDKAKNAMSLVTHSKYKVSLSIEDTNFEQLQKKIDEFLKEQEIIALKEQPKKGFKVKEVNIKPMIVEMTLLEGIGDRYSINCLLLCGSKANLKPELLLKSFSKYLNCNFYNVRINRQEVYTELNNQLVDLLKYAESEI